MVFGEIRISDVVGYIRFWVIFVVVWGVGFLGVL